MKLRYSYRVYPDAGQRNALARAFGCARVVFNVALRARQDAYRAGQPFLPDAVLSARLTEAKKTPERAWLGEVSAVVLQQSLADLSTAYRNFFTSVSGERPGPKLGPPRFKSRKDHRQTIRFTKNARFKVTDRGLVLPKIGEVEVRWSRAMPSDPGSVTIIKDAAGRYFASFVVESIGIPLPQTEDESSIDVGLTAYAVLPDGTKIDNPRWLRRRERKLGKLQREHAKKEKGSANRAKARLKVARQHAKVADARRDFHHQLSTALIRDNQAIYVEDLSVGALAKGMLAKSVNDAGWGAFLAMLEYKAQRYGRTVIKIDRWFPSSQLCPCCGWKVGKLPLGVREWDCRSCGEHHDRDVAAALNILAEGIRLRQTHQVAAGPADTRNDCGESTRPARAPSRGAALETLTAQAA
ncbi:RNA-guided endonuclease InsQ/TnpB family protein [Nonomuraea sp. NPDC049714]|uniref:RNA-guided endonuclease InsQ/TnpB family protein n=1 Tax=Nonomuraea sp. NPDC049714 TaxID=3364357 RepID=UPI0037A5423D